MNTEQEAIDFLNYVKENCDHIRNNVINNDVLWIRNYAASRGLELTPQEVRDCIKVFEYALRISKC
jgi:hypothetical protein